MVYQTENIELKKYGNNWMKYFLLKDVRLIYHKWMLI